MTDNQTSIHLDEAEAHLRAIEAAIEATLWDSSLEESEALTRYQQARADLEALLKRCDQAVYPAGQALLAYVLLREDDCAFACDSDLPASLERLQRAVQLAEASGDTVQLGRCLMVLGERRAMAGQTTEAKAAWDHCEALARTSEDYSHRQLLGWLLIMRMRQAMREDKLAHALELAQEAKRLLESIEDEAGMGALYSVLALLYEGLGRSTADIAIAQAEAVRWTARARRKHASKIGSP